MTYCSLLFNRTFTITSSACIFVFYWIPNVIDLHICNAEYAHMRSLSEAMATV